MDIHSLQKTPLQKEIEMFQYKIIDLSKYSKITARVCIPAESKIFVYSIDDRQKIVDMVRLKFGIFNSKTRTDRWVEISEWLEEATIGSIYDALPDFIISVKEREYGI